MRILNLTLRTFLFTVLFSFLTCACAGTNSGESPRVFVQAFYSWYTPIALKKESLPAVDITIKEKKNLFDEKLYGELVEDSNERNKHPDSIAGLDFDPFLATQDPCEKYQVGQVTYEVHKVKVDVYGVCDGKKGVDPDVEVELSKKDNGQWIFSNFYYPPYGDKGNNLLATLKLLKQAREKNHKP